MPTACDLFGKTLGLMYHFLMEFGAQLLPHRLAITRAAIPCLDYELRSHRPGNCYLIPQMSPVDAIMTADIELAAMAKALLGKKKHLDVLIFP